MRENHYAIHCAKDANFLGFHHHKISITLLIISNMSGDGFHQIRFKITKSFSRHNIFHKEISCFRYRFCNIGLNGYYCKENNTSVRDKK